MNVVLVVYCPLPLSSGQTKPKRESSQSEKTNIIDRLLQLTTLRTTNCYSVLDSQAQVSVQVSICGREQTYNRDEGRNVECCVESTPCCVRVRIAHDSQEETMKNKEHFLMTF